VVPSSVSSVYYDKICLKFTSHQFLLYAVYVCQKSLNFTYTFKCYQQNCSWLHFTWTTLYILTIYRSCVLLKILRLKYSYTQMIQRYIVICNESDQKNYTFIGLFSRTTWVSRHQKGTPFWILRKQETMGWQWHQLDHMQIICTTLQTDNHASIPSLNFLRAGCSS